jgi:hypothetical protein
MTGTSISRCGHAAGKNRPLDEGELEFLQELEAKEREAFEATVKAEASGLDKFKEMQRAAALQQPEDVGVSGLVHHAAFKKRVKGKPKLKVAPCANDSHAPDLVSHSSHPSIQSTQKTTPVSARDTGGARAGPRMPVQNIQNTHGEPAQVQEHHLTGVQTDDSLHRKDDASAVEDHNFGEASSQAGDKGSRSEPLKGLQGLLGPYAHSSSSDADEDADA